MINILYLMGKSSSGKDTVKNKLIVKLKELNYRIEDLVIYTTREIRSGEVEGIDYKFVDECKYQKLLNNNMIIEARTYEKIQGTVRYFTVYDDALFSKDADYIVGVGTLVSYNQLVDYFKKEGKTEYNIIPIYLEVENASRLLRAVRRELTEVVEKQNFEEVCRRFEADELDYSEENIRNSGIRDRFQNNNIQETVVEICKYLQTNN